VRSIVNEHAYSCDETDPLMRSSLYFAAVVVTAASNFFVNYLLAHALSLDDYGRFSLLSAGLAILSSFFMLGQASSLTIAYFSGEKKNCWNVRRELRSALKNVLLSTAAFGVAAVGIWAVGYSTELSFVLLLLAIVAAFCRTVQELLLSLANCMDRYREYFIATLAGGATLAAIAALLPSLQGYLIAAAGGAVVVIASIVPGVRRGIGGIVDPPRKVFTGRELIALGWVAIPGMLISSIAAFADRFILGQMLNLSEVAIYSLGMLLSVNLGRVVVNALLKSGSIRLFQGLQDTGERGSGVVLRRAEWSLCRLGLFASVVYYAGARPLVVAVFGERFSGSVPILLSLFSAVLLEGMMFFMAQVLIQQKKLYLAVISGGAVLVLNIAFNLALIPLLGINGAVLALFLGNAAGLIIVYWQNRMLGQRFAFPWFLAVVSTVAFALSLAAPGK
jgi:O-antigen/teichoic acid export membrane protein